MKQKTRQKIIAAAINELARNPGASIEQIALAAEVSRITVFRYFSTRQKLKYALNQEANRVFFEIMEPLMAEDLPAGQKLRKLVEVLIPYGGTFRFLLYEPYRSEDPHMERLLQDYKDSLHKMMRTLAAEGLLSSHTPIWWATRHLDTLLWIAWDSIDQGELAPKAAPDLILQTFYHGTGTQGDSPS